MDGRVSACEWDTTHWAADRNSNDNHRLVQRPAEEKTLRSIVRSQFLLFLEQAKGYVKALEKSTSRALSLRDVYEPCAQID
jgi:hypothetical protein